LSDLIGASPTQLVVVACVDNEHHCEDNVLQYSALSELQLGCFEGVLHKDVSLSQLHHAILLQYFLAI
jgi:hypothetical protein